MMNLFNGLAQSTPNFWRLEPGSGQLMMWLAIAFIGSAGLVFLISMVPSQFRRSVVTLFTFLAGAVFVAKFLWPAPVAANLETDVPLNGVESVGFWLGKAIDPVAKVANALAAFMLGLGIFSLVRVHVNKIRRKQTDWIFSIILLVSFVVMMTIGFLDWRMREFQDAQGLLNLRDNWTTINYANDLLFDGLYQQMDSAMFSIIAFFILSAAFRAFRIRSVEATVMMASALILMLNLMGALTFVWGNMVDQAVLSTGNPFLANLNITEIANWLRSNMQVPAIRAIEFGVGLGALAMGLRIWLGLEKGGVSA